MSRFLSISLFDVARTLRAAGGGADRLRGRTRVRLGDGPDGRRVVPREDAGSSPGTTYSRIGAA
jgi:hypothetical protein